MLARLYYIEKTGFWRYELKDKRMEKGSDLCHHVPLFRKLLIRPHRPVLILFESLS